MLGVALISISVGSRIHHAGSAQTGHAGNRDNAQPPIHQARSEPFDNLAGSLNNKDSGYVGSSDCAEVGETWSSQG